jgi:hypothetical protein
VLLVLLVLLLLLLHVMGCCHVRSTTAVVSHEARRVAVGGRRCAILIVAECRIKCLLPIEGLSWS